MARRSAVWAATIVIASCALGSTAESVHPAAEAAATPAVTVPAPPATAATTTSVTMRSAPPVLTLAPEPHLRWHALTTDGGSPYRLVASPGAATVSLRGMGGTGNTRIVFWDDDVVPTVDQLSCATWTSQGGPHDQQGAALRISTDDGHVRAITVTKSVWIFNYVFNVHLWDSADPGRLPGIAQFDLSPALGAPRRPSPPLPWRLCARVTGSRLDFLVWPVAVPAPQWGDRRYGGSLQLPPGWERPGRPGWYAGHLHPGDELGYTDLVPVGPPIEPRAGSVKAAVRAAGP